MSGTAQLVNISQASEDSILRYGQAAQWMLQNQFSIRGALQQIDREYMREMDWTAENLRARLANNAGDAKRFQNLQVPIIMPQVEASMGYMLNVFLTGSPIFSVAAAPQEEAAARQFNSIIEENSKTQSWARELMMFFRDGLKYNINAIELEWKQETTYQIDTDLANTAGNFAKPKAVKWAGNKLKRLDPYNMFFDMRVAPAEIYKKGEYAGYTEIMSRVQLKQLCNDLYGIVDKAVVNKALKSTPAAGVAAAGMSPYTYYIPSVNPMPMIQPLNIATFDWTAWATNTAPTTQINYQNVYVVTRVYGRILPMDFGLSVPEKNTPQVWKFIIINGQVVLHAERMTNVFNWIPIFFGQPIEDGLTFQTKSMAQNVVDLQFIASAMWRGFIASKRRLVGDRVLYDPSRIDAKAINSDAPAAKIPVKPSAYGTPLGESVYAFPYHDEATQGFLQGADMISRFADLINGQNPAQQGQFVKGNKTLHEYEDTMGHGNVHNQMMAVSLEQQVFIPLKEYIKMNIMQFQIDGQQIFSQNLKANVKVDVTTLRSTSAQFKVSDGVSPQEKEMATDEWTSAIQMLATSPGLGQGYNIAPAFSYVMNLRGVDLSPFEKSQEQVQYEQALGVWREAAANAAKTGAAFNTPMPQPPTAPQTPQPGSQPAPAGGSSQAPPVSAATAGQASALAGTQGNQ